MARLTRSYPLKLPQTAELQAKVAHFQSLIRQASHELLEALWSDGWIDALASGTNKAYKVIDEKTVGETALGQQVYLPSRIRRGIVERVGRILRSQAERKQCYYDVLQVVQVTGVEGNLEALVKTVAWTLIQFTGKYYKRALIRQHLRTFRRYYYTFHLDVTVLEALPYTQMIRPRIKAVIFPYAGDDGLNGQTIKCKWTITQLQVSLKLPATAHPLTRKEWVWVQFTLPIPPNILSRIQQETSRVHLPTLRWITLKSGLVLPFLECAWSCKLDETTGLGPKRVLATDLGVINLTTSVVCEAGSQISRPIFWSPPSTLLHKIEQLYQHIARIQEKLDTYPPTWRGQGKRFQERERLYWKLNRFKAEILHLTSNHLIETALLWHCQTIVLEDLRSYEPPPKLLNLSHKLSNWLRGALWEVLSYKTARYGLTLQRVNPRWTSSYCPRCGQKGNKITDPRFKTVNKAGRFFHCSQCGFTADRDYIASLNVYRMYQELRKKRYRLKFATPVPYTATGIPLNRLSGDTTQACLD